MYQTEFSTDDAQACVAVLEGGVTDLKRSLAALHAGISYGLGRTCSPPADAGGSPAKPKLTYGSARDHLAAFAANPAIADVLPWKEIALVLASQQMGLLAAVPA